MASECFGIFNLFRKSARVLNRSIQEVRESYVTFVSQNPEAITQIEKSVKTLSYALEFIPRNYDNSIFLTELLNSANSLFSYVNDSILKKSPRFRLTEDDSMRLVILLKKWLTIVEFTQAFVEMSAHRLGGKGARWAVIVIISLIKASLRLVLLYWFKSGILCHPPIKPLKREALLPITDDGEPKSDGKTTRPFVYVGRRTGHVMRTLAHTPPMHARTWEAPDPHSEPYDMDGGRTGEPDLPLDEHPTNLSQQEEIGETLHIIRPLLHLVGVGFFGSQSMVPWLISLITDASSHTLISGQVNKVSRGTKFNSSERKELQRRALIMILYLLRSPVYDRFTKVRILKLMRVLSDHVPLARYVMEPLARYLPVWQQVYFYAWSE